MTERSIEDRTGEALRIWRHGQIRPLWQDASEGLKDQWRAEAEKLLRFMGQRGLKVVIEEGDKGDE